MESGVPVQKRQKNSRVLQCGKCDYSCFNSSSLTYHRQAKHSNLRCICRQCDKEFKTNLDLVAHNRKLHKVGYFCFLCSFSSDAMKLMIKHRGKVHAESKNPEQVDTNSFKSEKESLNPTEIKDEQEKENLDSTDMKDEKENLNHAELTDEQENHTEIKDEKEMIKSEAPYPKKTRAWDKTDKERKKQLWAEYYPKHKDKIKERNILRHKRKREECKKLKEKSEGGPSKTLGVREDFAKVKKELEVGQTVKTESNGFLQGLQVQNGVKLKSRLRQGVKIDPDLFIATSKAHPPHSFVLDGRKKPVLEIDSHTLRFCKFWSNERFERFAYFYCVGKVRVKCRVSAKAFCVSKERSEQEKTENTICIDGQTIELYLVTLSGQHVENCQYKRERIQREVKGGHHCCEICDYQTVRFYDLLDHREMQHKAVEHACPQCDVKSNTTKSMRSHMKNYHNGKYLSCPDCNYITKKLAHLTVHKESIHEGRRHTCDICGMQMTQKSHIRKHKESVHEGVRYKCDQCEYTASQRGHLRTHKSVIHLGVIFNCGLCEYQSSYKSDLNRHRKKDHPSATTFEDLRRVKQRKTGSDIKKVSKMTEKEKKRQLWAAYYPRKRERILRRIKLRNKRKSLAKMQEVCEKMRVKMEAAISNKIENCNETNVDQFADDDKMAGGDEYQKAFEPLTNVFIEVNVKGAEASESVVAVFLEEPKKEEVVKEEQDEDETQANPGSYGEESYQASDSTLPKANISKAPLVQENVKNEIDASSLIRGSKEWEDQIVKNVTVTIASMF